MADRLVTGQARRAAQAAGGGDLVGVVGATDSRRRSASPGRDHRDGLRPGSPWNGRTTSWMGTIAAIISSNRSNVSACSPSDSASSGRGWTSTMIPSAPAATPAIASGFTSHCLPVACDGSTMTGRCVRCWTMGTAVRSSVFRLYVSNVRMPRSHRITLGLPAEDVLGGHQPLLDRRAVAALEHHRAPGAADGQQQREVLHVPGADLEDVGVLGHDVDLGGLHDLRDRPADRSARALRRGSEGPRRPAPGSCTGWCAA